MAKQPIWELFEGNLVFFLGFVLADPGRLLLKNFKMNLTDFGPESSLETLLFPRDPTF